MRVFFHSLTAPALVLALGVGLAAAPAQAELPQRNLLVSWRLNSSDTARVQQRGVQGGVVVSTQGGMSGQGLVTYGTREGHDSRQAEMQVLVLNGQPARLQIGQQQPVTQWQFLVSPQAGQGVPAYPGGASVQAVSSTVMVEQNQGLKVRPRWSGRGPVQLDFEVQGDVANGLNNGLPTGLQRRLQAAAGQPATTEQVQAQAVVAVPMDQWVAVARSGRQVARSQRGTWSTDEVDQGGTTVLEIKVSLP
ncbi:MAG: hypothetical protein RLZZ182_2528 [Pseudomonadota bacterium]